MDPNDRDIAYILALEAVAPLDSQSWRVEGYVSDGDLSSVRKELLNSHAPSVKFTYRDGRRTLSASEWIAACHTMKQKLFGRMYLRSLRMAANGPDAAMIASAPCLRNWLPVRDAGDLHAVLIGLVCGHPILSARWIRTSRLCGIDPDGTWARTASRWYRLEDSSTAGEIAKQLGDRGTGVSGVALSLHDALSRTQRTQVKLTLILFFPWYYSRVARR